MAVLGTKFNATEHDTEQKDFELLPDMIARLEAVQGDVKADDDGNGTTLVVDYGVVEPEQYKNRRFRAWITLESNDSTKQERGQRDLARLCRAIGVSEVSDSDELLFHGFTAKVKKNPAGVSKKGVPYNEKNSISKFFFPDSDDMPEIGIIGPKAANDNRPQVRQAANNNTPPRGDARTTGNGGAAATGKARPWGKRSA